MIFSESLKRNSDFRRLYSKGKSAASATLVVYFRYNGRGINRLGITVSTKVGKAVTRNKIRRRLREIYRLSEGRFKRGLDIVAVARSKSPEASYAQLERDFLSACGRLGLLRDGKAKKCGKCS